MRNYNCLRVMLFTALLGLVSSLIPFAEVTATAAEPCAGERCQIYVRAVVLSIDKRKLAQAGINWEPAGDDSQSPPARMAVMDQVAFEKTLESLKRSGGKILSEPTTMTVSGQEVRFTSGARIAIPVTERDAGGQRMSALKPYEFGTFVRLTPTLLGADLLRLDVEWEQSEAVNHTDGEQSRRGPIIVGIKSSWSTELTPRQTVLFQSSPHSPADDKARSTVYLTCLSPELVEQERTEKAQASRAGNEDTATLREEVRELRAQVVRLTESVAARGPLPAPPRKVSVERAVATERITDIENEDRLVTKVYAVADLVVPVVDVRPKGHSSKVEAEFQPLIDLITANIEPESWKLAGRNLAGYEANLSLVVSQSATAHEKIADLLTKLRDEQDRMMQFEIQLVSVRREAIKRFNIDWGDEPCTLAPAEAKLLRDTLAGDPATKILAAPRVILMNKQLCELQTGLEGDRQFRLLLTGAFAKPPRETEQDRLRINLAINARDPADAVRSGVSETLASGETLAIDISNRVGSEEPHLGVPLLQKIPHVDRLFKNVGPANRTLLFVTPTARKQEEAPHP